MINVSSLAPPIYLRIRFSSHQNFIMALYGDVTWVVSRLVTCDILTWHPVSIILCEKKFKIFENLSFSYKFCRQNSLKVVKTNKPRHQVVGWNSENSFLNIYKVIISIHIMWWGTVSRTRQISYSPKF